MKQDGLSFGNLLSDRNGKHRPIVLIGSKGVTFFNYYLNGTDKDGRKTAIIDEEETPYELINPITLDEHVLIDFGFEIGDDGAIKTATLGKFRLWYKENWGSWVFVTGATHSVHNSFDVKLPYLHLLQNIYFILHGKALDRPNLNPICNEF